MRGHLLIIFGGGAVLSRVIYLECFMIRNKIKQKPSVFMFSQKNFINVLDCKTLTHCFSANYIERKAIRFNEWMNFRSNCKRLKEICTGFLWIVSSWNGSQKSNAVPTQFNVIEQMNFLLPSQSHTPLFFSFTEPVPLSLIFRDQRGRLSTCYFQNITICRRRQIS